MPDLPAEVEVCVKLRARDVYWATFLSLANRVLLGIFAVIACADVLNAVLNGQYTQVYIFPLLCIFVFVIVPWIQAVISMRKPVMKSPFCHSFSPLGISTQFRGGSLTLEWNNIKKAAESKQYVAIYGKSGAPMLIPKGQLAPGQLASLQGVLDLHLGNKAKLKISRLTH